MTTDTPRQAIATRQNSQGRNSPACRISELTRTLAPSRPASMSDDMASDWLAVVVAETADMSDATFLAACKRARRECSFHNQILPTMLKQSDDLAEFVRKMDALAVPFLADHRPPPKRQAIEASAAQKLIDAAAKNLKA